MKRRKMWYPKRFDVAADRANETSDAEYTIDWILGCSRTQNTGRFSFQENITNSLRKIEFYEGRVLLVVLDDRIDWSTQTNEACRLLASTSKLDVEWACTRSGPRMELARLLISLMGGTLEGSRAKPVILLPDTMDGHYWPEATTMVLERTAPMGPANASFS